MQLRPGKHKATPVNGDRVSGVGHHDGRPIGTNALVRVTSHITQDVRLAISWWSHGNKCRFMKRGPWSGQTGILGCPFCHGSIWKGLSGVHISLRVSEQTHGSYRIRLCSGWYPRPHPGASPRSSMDIAGTQDQGEVCQRQFSCRHTFQMRSISLIVAKASSVCPGSSLFNPAIDDLPDGSSFIFT